MLQGTAPGTLWGVLPSGLRVDGHSFFVRFLWQAVLFGQSPMVYEPNREGHPKAGTLRLLEPFAVKRNRAGRWVILAEREEDRIEVDHDGYFYLGNGVQLRLVVLTGPSDGAGPDGVLVRHWRTFRLAANVRDYIAGAFDGAGIPSGFLTVKTPNFSQDKADELKKKWNEAHGGQRRGIAVLNAMVDYSPVSVSPVDTDAAAMSTVSLRDIAHAFGLDPSWLGAQIGGSSLTYRNVAEVRRDLVDAVLAPWSERLMSVLQSCMPITHRVRVDWSDYVSPSWQEMLPLVVSGVQAGVMTHVEARRKLGFDPGVGPDPNFDSWLAEREGNAGNPII
jgi:HK97 family phage portal protein